MIVKVKFFIITLNLFVLLTTNVLAATPNTFSTLSNVNKIFQGESGFIWLAGQQGLIRVDGNENINFSLNNLEWPLLFNWIHDVYRIDDNLLIATENSGLWLFNTKNGQSEKIPVNTASQSYYDVVAFQGYYYINVLSQLTTKKNLYRFDPQTNITQLLYNDIKIDDLVHSKDNLFVSSADGLFKLNDEKLIKIIEQPITAVTALNNSVIAITANKLVKLADGGNRQSIRHNEKIYGLTKEYSTNNFFTINAQG
jgi:ligand-binding sensor domain-containing protein